MAIVLVACGLLICGRRGIVHWIGCAGMGGGIVVVLALDMLMPGRPPRPGYSVTIIEPPSGARVTSPIRVMTCARFPSGDSAEVPGSGRVLTVFVDGRQISSANRAEMVVGAAIGRHTIGVEVLTSDHREFQPQLAVDESITVTGPGSMRESRICPL